METRRPSNRAITYEAYPALAVFTAGTFTVGNDLKRTAVLRPGVSIGAVR
jgi:hypothetical protein